MQIDSSLAGKSFRTNRVAVTWRQTTNFAAGIHDMNPLYFDDRRAGGLIAHPMFIAAVSWPLFLKLAVDGELPYPPEVLQTLVHHTQTLQYHRPLTPGMELVLQGQLIAIVPRRGGTRLIFRQNIADSDGQPVITEHAGVFLRGVTLDGEGVGTEELPVIPAAEAPAVQWEEKIRILPEDPYIYDGCSENVFAIHTSPSFAHLLGLPDIIYQGAATLAQAVRELVNREADGDATRLTMLSAQFSHMVLPNTEIAVQCLGRTESAQERQCWFQVLNEAGKPAVTKGYALFRQ